MEHAKDCDFNERIRNINEGDWSSGEGEISGYVYVNEKEITFNDGWNFYPKIEFKYCPICGAKLDLKH